MKRLITISAISFFLACESTTSNTEDLVFYEKLEGNWETSFIDLEQPSKTNVNIKNNKWLAVTIIQPNATDKSLDSTVADCIIKLSNDSLERNCNNTYFYNNGKTYSRELNLTKAIFFENENTFHITNIDDVEKVNGNYQINDDWQKFIRTK